MSIETNKNIVCQFIQTTLNDGKVEDTSDYVHDDVVELDPFPGQGPGVEGLKAVLKMLLTAFPDMHWVVEEQIGEADKVLTRFLWTGTHRGEFLGMAATNRPVAVRGMVIDRLEENKIKDTRILMDMFGLMTQMGTV